MSEGTKGEKSRNEIDKLIKQAGNFYQDTADSEGRGRLPGQSKFNIAVGGGDYDNSDASSAGILQLKLLQMPHGCYHGRLRSGQSDGWRDYDATHTNVWVSCFGTLNADAPLPEGVTGVIDNESGVEEWKALVGGETLSSKFQDGHYVYTVVAGVDQVQMYILQYYS